MGKIKEIKTLVETKFISLYDIKYLNKNNQEKSWTVASRKSKDILEGIYLENKKDQKSYYADINNNSTSKGRGITSFLNIFNIKKEDSLCFGDFINDIDMFKACGYKVAMKNASEELKEIADYVTLSNNEAGVGDFIEKFILK